MNWPKLLVLVRHAESVGNLKSADERADFSIPTWDYELTARGRQQAIITGKYLKRRFGKFDIYYTSYYRRSKETLALMYPEAKVYEDPRLAELQRGIWHVMTKEEIKKRFPEEIIRKKREGLYHYRPLGGESWADVELRIHSFLGTLNRDCDGQKVLVIVHGNWLILLQKLIHHFSIEEAIGRHLNKPFANASVTIYKNKNIRNKSRLILIKENIIPWQEKI